MQFLYKQGKTTYEQLLPGTREADQFSDGRGTSVKAKAATAHAGTSKDTTISDINERIDMLVVILEVSIPESK